MKLLNKILDNPKYADLPKPLRKNKYKFILLLVLPGLLNFIIFYVIKNLSSILMAFRQFTGFSENGERLYEFSFNHFKRFFDSISSEGDVIRAATLNTLLFWANNMLIMLPLTFALSYFFYKKISGYKFFRVAVFIPSILGGIVMTTIYKVIVAPNGPISMFFAQWSGEMFPGLLSDEKTAKWMIVLYCIWTGMSGNILIFQGSMSRIPQELLDAAAIDGVGSFGEFRHLIIPMTWGTLSTVIILNFTGLFASSGPILLFTGGAYDTYTLSYWIFAQVQNQTNTNYAAAIGLIFTVVLFPIVLCIRKLCAVPYKDVEY